MTTKDGKGVADAEPAEDGEDAGRGKDAEHGTDTEHRTGAERGTDAERGKDAGSGTGAGKGRSGKRANGPGSGTDGDGSAPADRISMPEALRAVTSQLTELLRAEPAGVSALKSTGDGWTAQVEVVEVERIPDTTSVMASYRVDLDGRGRLVGYERTARYARGRVDR